jgi:hypothetical protein
MITMSADAVLDALAADAEIPVQNGVPVAQGDVLLIPVLNGEVSDAKTDLPLVGVELLRGQGGHAHLLLGKIQFDAGNSNTATIGTITVPAGQIGYLAHGDGTPVSALGKDAEHGLQAFGPGTYVVRRQREQAEEERLVSD